MFLLSPGVNVSEIDLTTIIPAVGTTQGAFAGNFNWGPVNEVRTVTSELDLVNFFGEPDSNNFTHFFTAANFLAYAQDLKIVRANSSFLLNSTANGAGISIQNLTDYEQNHSAGANTNGVWAAKWPGTLGNSLKVSMYTGSNTTNFISWPYNGYFEGTPTTSTYVTNQNGVNDELHVIVIDEDGRFSGIANTVLEKFSYVSKASDAVNDDGTSNYYVNVINQQSRYLWWLAHPDTGLGVANTQNWGSQASGTSFGTGDNTAYTVSLTNGQMNVATTAGITLAYDKFKNKDEVDVSLILTADHSPTVISYINDNITTARKDCILFASPLMASVVNNYGGEAAAVVSDRNNIDSSSYGVMDSGWKYQFDKYNNVYRWVPLNGDIAGLCVYTDYVRAPWFSPAGFNRGIIKNVIKLAWNPNQTDRDTLYKNGVNPVVTFPGNGTILYGDKTLSAKPSAFDRINVRRLFIVLEEAISLASKYSLFEFNDSFTRAQFVSLVEPYLRDIQGQRGIYDFRVVCDETNNTPEIIDQNQFVGDIYIKPARSVNFISLRFVAVATGVSFDEIIGQF